MCVCAHGPVCMSACMCASVNQHLSDYVIFSGCSHARMCVCVCVCVCMCVCVHVSHHAGVVFAKRACRMR